VAGQLFAAADPAGVVIWSHRIWGANLEKLGFYPPGRLSSKPFATAHLAKRTVAMSIKKRHTVSAGVLAGVLALVAIGFFLLIAGHHAPAIALSNAPATAYRAGRSVVPRVSVIVDGELPLESSTGIVLHTSGTTAWVTEEVANDGRLVRVDLASGEVASVCIELNQPGHFVVSDTVAIVAGNIGAPVTLVRIDLNDGTVTPISDELFGGLSGVDVNGALTQAHVVNFGNGVLSQVDIDPSLPTFKQVTQVASGLDGPRDIVLNIDETAAYVTEQNAGRLVQVNIDPTSPDYGNITPIASALSGPRGLTLNQNGSLVYVAEEFSRELSVVDVDPGSPGFGNVTTILDGQALRDVALSPDELLAVVTDASDGVLIIDIDPASSDFGHIVSHVTPVPLDGARGLDLNASQTLAYVVEEFSGELSRIDIDPDSPDFGAVARVTGDQDIPAHVMITQDGSVAYITTQRGPDRGVHSLRQVDLATGQTITVTDEVELPSGLDLDDAETYAYVAEPPSGSLHRVSLTTGVVELVASGIPDIFGVRLNPGETHAYVTTSEFGPTSPPPKEFLKVDLASGSVTTITTGLVSPTGIWINTSETRAYVAEFGEEGGCSGALSMIDIDATSPTYGVATRLLTGLCGPHDVRLSTDESTAYVVEVDGKRLIRVDLLYAVYLPALSRSN
jgi:DNA-binding beta-propeller fold protein YncE